ncbi:MAG: hypothetical protein ACQESJ_02715 [Bacteroidota bacterium]
MFRNRLVLLLSFVLLMTLSSFGQKIRYKDYRNDISTKNYRDTIINPKYSPLVAGVCNHILPSAGYFYVGEPLRGACVFGSEFVTSSVFFYGLLMSMSVDSETGRSPDGARAIMYSGMIATGLIQIWSIYDVVKIAKIKNLAYQENKLTIEVKPGLFFVNQNNTTVYGLRLSINF